MKKTVTIVLLLSIIALSGCTIDEKNTSAETEISTETESNDEKTEEEDSEPEPPKREEVLAALKQFAGKTSYTRGKFK